MDKREILNYIKEYGEVRVEDIQRKFDMDYMAARSIIVDLVLENALDYKTEEVTLYSVNEDPMKFNPDALKYWIKNNIKKIQEGKKYFETEEKLQEFLNKNGKEIFEYLCEDSSNKDYSDDEDDECVEYDDGEEDDEKLRFEVLKFCIEKNSASVSFIQRSFPIGYIKACKLIDWMEREGYISESRGAKPRKILITKAKFNKLDNNPYQADDGDFGKFLNDYSDEEYIKEDEIYSNIIKRIFDSDEKDSCDSFASTDEEFKKSVQDKLDKLIKSDRRMGLKGAVKRVETYLEAVREAADVKMIRVYEGLLSKLENMSESEYAKRKRKLFGKD